MILTLKIPSTYSFCEQIYRLIAGFLLDLLPLGTPFNKFKIISARYIYETELAENDSLIMAEI